MVPNNLVFDLKQTQPQLVLLLVLDRKQQKEFFQIDLITTFFHLFFLLVTSFHTYLEHHYLLTPTIHDVSLSLYFLLTNVVLYHLPANLLPSKLQPMMDVV